MSTAIANLQAARKVSGKCEVVAGVLRSLSHPVRLKILGKLVERESSVNELKEVCAVSQSAMSQFLKRMRAEGLVTSRRAGQSIIYRVADPKLHKLMRAMSEIYC